MKKSLKISLLIPIMLFAAFGIFCLGYLIVIKVQQATTVDYRNSPDGFSVYTSSIVGVIYNKFSNTFTINDHERNRVFSFSDEPMFIDYDFSIYLDKTNNDYLYLVHYYTSNSDHWYNEGWPDGPVIVFKINGNKLEKVFSTNAAGLFQIMDSYIVSKRTKLVGENAKYCLNYPFLLQFSDKEITLTPITNDKFTLMLKNTAIFYEEGYKSLQEKGANIYNNHRYLDFYKMIIDKAQSN